ncbi:MAG: hypothetical protein EAY69_06670 [Cytophagales bacterium]|nr:MAG: hypothetical protein EAY69_06670 [Cytophagales bacterium]
MIYLIQSFFYVFVFFLFFSTLQAQNIVSDSLKKAIKKNYATDCRHLFDVLEYQINQKDTNIVREYLFELLTFFENKKFEKGICNVYILQSSTFNSTNGSKSLMYLEKALRIADKNNFYEEKTIILCNKGSLYAYEYYSPEKGLPFILEGLNIATKYQLKSMMINLRQRLIAVLYTAQHYTKTRDYCFELMNTYPKEINLTQKMSLYNTIGLTYQRQKKNSQALYYFNKCIDLAIQHNNKAWIGIARGNIGRGYEIEKKYKEAIKAYEIDIEYSMLTRQWGSAFVATQRLMICYKKTEQSQKALKMIALTDSIRRKDFSYNMKFQLLESEAMLEYYLLDKNIEKVWQYKSTIQQLQDSIQQGKRTEQIEKILSSFEIGLKEEKIKELEKSQEKQYIINQQKNLFIIGLFIFSSISIIFSSILYALYHKNRKLNKNLQTKNQQIETQTEDLKKTNFAKDKLFSIISHDFRNPLANLGSLLKLFNDGHITDKELRHFTKDFQQRAETTLVFIDNLLYWARNQMHGLEAIQKKCNLKETIDEIVYLLTTQFENKSLIIENKSNPTLFLWVDDDMLRLIIRNLLTNAAKFSFHKGKITIDTQEKENSVVCSIQDEGIGMTEEQQDKLFKYDSFNSTLGTNHEKGTGLGLILCYDFIQINKGDFKFVSEPNKGTTFYFELPKYKQTEQV